MLFIYIFQHKVTGLFHRTILMEDNIEEAYKTAQVTKDNSILFKYKSFIPNKRLPQ